MTRLSTPNWLRTRTEYSAEYYIARKITTGGAYFCKTIVAGDRRVAVRAEVRERDHASKVDFVGIDDVLTGRLVDRRDDSVSSDGRSHRGEDAVRLDNHPGFVRLDLSVEIREVIAQVAHVAAQSIDVSAEGRDVAVQCRDVAAQC